MPSTSKTPRFVIEDVLQRLTLPEKVSLLSGIDAWHTASVERLNVPSIRMSDGPNGVRGTKFFNGVPAACLPCGTGMAATWDIDLVKAAGMLQGREAIAKGAHVLLGPTCNMQRSPLGGRGFESFSEDPYLAGSMAAAAINGVQSTKVAATIKHFVCNDSEDHRSSVDAIVTARALREIYLMPFQIAQRDSRPACFMTSYNKVNGTHASENKSLIHDILREEWGFDGLIMSDWHGTYSTDGAIQAGLDLEMPGPPLLRGNQIVQALTCGKITLSDIDARVRAVLKLVQRVESLAIDENAPETTVDSPETSAFLRQLAGDTIVLLKNNSSVLPLGKNKKTAIIGPNAAYAAYCGGGSASLLPYYAVSPLDGIREFDPNAVYALGAPGWRNLPLMSRLSKTLEGQPGLNMKIFKEPPSIANRRVVDEVIVTDSNILLTDYVHPELDSILFWIELDARFTPEESDHYDFGLMCRGTGKLYVDGQLIIDNETTQRPGSFCFGAGTDEAKGTMYMEKGKTYSVKVMFATMPTQTFSTPGAMGNGPGGLRLGLERRIDIIAERERAVKLASEADQVILCVGLSSEWESEGFDRPHMDLPPHSDELIEAVLAANPNTAIVVQSGTPVTMPWAQSAPAIIYAWYGGNETGNAIADVLFGHRNPSGKLPLTLPLQDEDNPAFLNGRSDRNRTLYGEDVFVGYRFYEKTKKSVAYPFGHGLSYTSFTMTNLAVVDKDEKLHISVDVSNTGSMAGAQVVQIYVAQRQPTVTRPVKELRGYAKVHLAAGEKRCAEVVIQKKYAASFWDEAEKMWIMEADTFDVFVGDSSESIILQGEFKVNQTTFWLGL